MSLNKDVKWFTGWVVVCIVGIAAARFYPLETGNWKLNTETALSVPAGGKTFVHASASSVHNVSPFSSYLNTGPDSPTPPGRRQTKPPRGVQAIDVTDDAVFEILLDAIEFVESRCDPKAIGALGEVGSFQISKKYLDDVNKISRQQRFKYAHRYERAASRQMARTYLRHYGKGLGVEQIARIHNGGPNGHKKKATEKYWLKVKQQLQKLRQDHVIKTRSLSSLKTKNNPVILSKIFEVLI